MFVCLVFFQLTEGRKQVGGKLEVKIRVRDPFKGKQVEETKEKWLVIDQFIRALGPKVMVDQCIWALGPKVMIDQFIWAF